MSTAAIVPVVPVTIFAVLRVSLVRSPVLACVCSAAVEGTLDALPILVQKVFAGGLQYSLLAIFFFVLAGAIMQYGGLSKRLVGFANSLVGHINRGAPLVRVTVCTSLAAISGSAVITTAAIGRIMYPGLKRPGYPGDYVTALPATAGVLGVIIPSSALFILYGNMASVSPGKLLMAGAIPGLMGAFFVCIMYYVFARGKSYLGNEGFEAKMVIKTLKDSTWALLMPIIILGGVYTGIFTPAKSGVVAVAYGLICATVIYRDMDLALFRRAIRESCQTTANVMILCMATTSFNYLPAICQISAILSRLPITSVSNHYMLIIGVTVLLLFPRMSMDVAAPVLILAPMLTPVAVASDIDPTQLGLIFVFIMAIGQAVPPFGTDLFVVCDYNGKLVMSIGKYSFVSCSASVFVIPLCTMLPGTSTLLPGVMTQ